MKYFRYGHCKDVYVKVGDKVNKGSLIGTIGTGNGQWSAHLHFDIVRPKLVYWTGYVFGMTKSAVEALYVDPAPYVKTVLPEYDHLGYDFLEHANYGTASAPKWCYHPGKDLNGKGAGDADLGDKIFSACSGKVVYCYDGADKNGGWGKLIVIEEVVEEIKTEQTPKIEEEKPIAVDVIPVQSQPEVIVGYDKASGEIKTAQEVQPQEIKENVVKIDWLFLWQKLVELFNKFKNK